MCFVPLGGCYIRAESERHRTSIKMTRFDRRKRSFTSCPGVEARFARASKSTGLVGSLFYTNLVELNLRIDICVMFHIALKFLSVRGKCSQECRH